MKSFGVTRRQLLKFGGAWLATSALGIKRSSAATEPIVIGLIWPPAYRPAPDEAKMMYPTGVKYLVTGLGLGKLTPEGYDSVIPKVANAAKVLRSQGAQGIILMGTSLTFYKGAEFNRTLTQSMRDATGLPCITMSTAIVEGLKAVNGKRVAAATAYRDEINRRLVAFLNEWGFQVEAVKGLSIEKIDDLDKVTDEQLMVLCADVCRSAPKADSLVISCGGLVTLRIHVELEKQYKLPVVSSTPAALWAGMRMMGHSGRSPGLGKLLE
jgi:arylmalonate decarboxylase